jgi:cysteinyl-tRNA synthetase
MHNGMIRMAQDKMSKSLGNVWYLRDLLKKFDSDVLKIFVLSKHYRIPIDVSEELLHNQEVSVNRVKESLNDAEAFFNGKVPYPREMNCFKEQEEYLISNLSNDFDTPSVVARIFELSRDLNKALNSRDEETIKNNYYIIRNIYGSILGVFETNEQMQKNKVELNQLMEIILNVRSALRKDNLFDLSDYIRDNLSRIGIQIKDSPEGTKWS